MQWSRGVKLLPARSIEIGSRSQKIILVTLRTKEQDSPWAVGPLFHRAILLYSFLRILMAPPALLILSLLLGIGFIIVATTRWKLHPFLALLLTAYGIGLASGLPPRQIVTALTGGFGGILGHIGIVIASGCVIGSILEKTGAAATIAAAVIRVIGSARAVLAMSCTGAFVSIPVFCDSGFVILAPLARSLARTSGRSMATFATALAMGLYTTHCLIPPTPGPIAAAGELGADLGWVMLLGAFVALPVIAATYLFAQSAGQRISISPPNAESPAETPPTPASYGGPAFLSAVLPILLPLTTIALRSIADLPARPLGDGSVRAILGFIGDPNTALLLGVLIAVLLARSNGRERLSQWTSEGLYQAGTIILITAAGGALGGVLRATPMALLISDSLAGLELGPLAIFLPFVVAATLKTALGSSTVALITTASLIAPLLQGLGLASGFGPVLATLAVASGSMVVSHANDSFFWIITQTSGLSVSQGYRLITLASLIAGRTAIACVTLLTAILL